MSGSGSGDHERAADELRLLARSLLDRAEPGIKTVLAGLHERADHQDKPAGEPADVPGSCTWCPLCAAVGLLRGERPELAAAILTHAESVLATLRAVLAPEPPPAPDADDEPPRVQHIPVRPC